MVGAHDFAVGDRRSGRQPRPAGRCRRARWRCSWRSRVHGAGFTIERVAYRPLRRAPRLAPLITAIGVSILLQTSP